MSAFGKNKHYLLHYELRNAAVYLAVIVMVVAAGGGAMLWSAGFLWYLVPVFLVSFFHFAVSLIGAIAFAAICVHLGDLSFSMADLPVVLAGVLVGAKSAAWMHNAAHRNFRWPWLSVAIGEICAVQQVIGYREWQIAHFIHHKHPDDPELDPHPPRDSGFLPYLLSMKFGIAMKFEKYYYSSFGKNGETEKIWGVTGLLMLASGLAKVLIWYALLGPKYFLLFFVVSNITTNVTYAHFNYFTHRPSKSEPGKFDILDLNTGFYRVLNWYLAGSYCHKTHHARPRLYNPGLAAQR